MNINKTAIFLSDLEKFVSNLDSIVNSDLNYANGEREAIKLAELAGGLVKFIDAGGIEVVFSNATFSVFQPYPDIDRIYYEY